MVKSVFSAYGTVMSCKAMPSKRPGQLGAALVRFANNGGGKGGGGGGGFAAGGNVAQVQGGKAGGKGKGKPGTFSNSDMQQVISGLMKQLPGTGKKPDENCLYITGLPTNTTDHDLYRIFAPFGAIPANGVKAKVNPDGTCSGVGFVDFNDPTHALAAQEALNGMVLPDGTTLMIRSKRPKGQGPVPQQE